MKNPGFVRETARARVLYFFFVFFFSQKKLKLTHSLVSKVCIFFFGRWKKKYSVFTHSLDFEQKCHKSVLYPKKKIRYLWFGQNLNQNIRDFDDNLRDFNHNLWNFYEKFEIITKILWGEPSRFWAKSLRLLRNDSKILLKSQRFLPTPSRFRLKSKRFFG